MKPDSFKVKQKTATFIPVVFLFKHGQLFANLSALVCSVIAWSQSGAHLSPIAGQCISSDLQPTSPQMKPQLLKSFSPHSYKARGISFLTEQ